MQKPEDNPFLFASMLHTPNQNSWEGQTRVLMNKQERKAKKQRLKTIFFSVKTQMPCWFQYSVNHQPGAATPNPREEAKWPQANQPTSQRNRPAEKFGEDCGALI